MTEISLTRFVCCRKCQITYPATTAYFHRNKVNKLGVSYVCKPCAVLKSQQWVEENRERCEQTRSAYRAKNKDLLKARSLKHREENREKIAEKKRTFYRENRERILQQMKVQRQANRDVQLARQAEYRKKHRKELAAKQAEYRRNNPEKYQEWASKNQNRKRANKAAYRARLLSAAGVHTDTDIVDLLKAQNYLCYYCERDLEDGYHVDHRTPLTRGGSNGPENLACACPDCNRRKHAMTEAEFRDRHKFYCE